MILDGTLNYTTRVAGKVRKPAVPPPGAGCIAGTPASCAVGANIRFLTAARTHGLIGPLCAAAAHGLTVLADKAYHSAGIGIHTPFKAAPGNHPLRGRPLHIDQHTHNTLHTSLRAPGERAAALLKTRWRALHRVTLSPTHLGTITTAALVLTQLEHQGRY